MAKMTVANGDGYSAIYVGDELIIEGDEITPEEAVQIAIEYDVTEVDSKAVNFDWMNNSGTFPPDISDVVWEDQEWELKEDDE